MEIFFNEIASNYPCASIHDARLRMNNFVQVCVKAREEGFRLCRIANEYYNILLADDYKIKDWLNDPATNKATKQIFLSYVRPPYETDNDAEINSYIEAKYLLNEQLELVESQLKPEEKKIHLSDDHGKDKLIALSKNLVHSPYVDGVPGSLPFKPKARSFIQKTYPDGRIDVTLFAEDAGYSMMIKTTGRNLRETQAIAGIIKDKFYS
ncbi:MAG: hypothetical protein GY754_32420 [bacterium]|nr:hypothetical protein [bacterium]